MAAAATTEQLEWEHNTTAAEPVAHELTALSSERFSRAKAERFIGVVATSAEAGIIHETGQPMSLWESSRRAARGEFEALQSMCMNVRGDVIERSIKKGHVTRTTQKVDIEGRTIQHGQSGRSIQANSLRFASQNPKMLPRTKAETRNLFRIEDAKRQGLLKDHYVVVPSRPADNMSEAEMHAEGFFVDTMSIALQATTEGANDEIITETAFVAGKRHRHAPRHDAELVAGLGQQIGIEVGELTAAQGIDRAWLVPKHLMPNGVIDLVRLADESMGTFFGEDRPAEDYLTHLDKCRQREAELESTVQEIVARLIAESNRFQTPLDATRRLHELSEAALVQRALYDEAIDTTVFGIESAGYLQAARYYLEQGDMGMVDRFMTKAISTADSNSCPGGGIKSLENGNASGKHNGTSSSESENCEFTSKKCPLCGKGNVRTVVKRLPSGKKHISGSCGCIKIAA
jgi:hypothetical protein